MGHLFGWGGGKCYGVVGRRGGVGSVFNGRGRFGIPRNCFSGFTRRVVTGVPVRRFSSPRRASGSYRRGGTGFIRLDL